MDRGVINMDIDAFLSANKSMIIAPAGFGKTYTIAECISSYKGNKKILVLTHTHAGIASLREKFEKRELSTSVYHLDTICSFALNLTNTYHINKNDIPSFSDPNSLFYFSIEHAIKILKANPIKKYLSIKYEHLIVDEYQDCTKNQHQMIMALADIMKTHILGDPLQGIFGFRGESIVDFSDESFTPFKNNCQVLEIPWRWINAGKKSLGKELISIRSKLLSSEIIDLREFHEIKCIIAPENDYAVPQTEYKKEIYRALNYNNVLLIHPISESIEPRLKFIQRFPMLNLIESIDDKYFYSCCALLDSSNGHSLVENIVNIMRKIGTSSKIDMWFNKSGYLKVKKSDLPTIQQTRGILEDIINTILRKKSYSNIISLIEAIKGLPEVKIYRKDFLCDLCKSLKEADRLGISVTESIVRSRNLLRRKGRKIQGKVIGTTLLTKGLEFDTVVILNAHLFTSKKHFYVALTRCCKRVIIISNSNILTFNND